MPATRGLTPDQKIRQQHKLLSAKCKGLMRSSGITQKELAEKTGLTQQAISYQLSSGITVPLFLAIVNMTNADSVEISNMIKIGGL